MTINPNKTFGVGDSGPEVRELQTLLIRCGFDAGPGGDDGFYGEHTSAAVRYFQSINRMPNVDGHADPNTTRAIEGYHQRIDRAKAIAASQGIDSWMISAMLISATILRDKEWPQFVKLWAEELREAPTDGEVHTDSLISHLESIKVPGRIDIMDALHASGLPWNVIIETFIKARTALGYPHVLPAAS